MPATVAGVPTAAPTSDGTGCHRCLPRRPVPVAVAGIAVLTAAALAPTFPATGQRR